MKVEKVEFKDKDVEITLKCAKSISVPQGVIKFIKLTMSKRITRLIIILLKKEMKSTGVW